MPNLLIAQGTLNRILANVAWTDFPSLNVTAPYLDKEGISLRLEGEASMQHGTMTGIVQSPEPYLPIGLTLSLLRTQSLSDMYKSQMQDNVVLGDGTVWPDVSTGLTPFLLYNMAIQSVGDLQLNGTTPIFGVSLRGFWVTNNSLWD
jgi:hypothetical protein